MTQPESLIDLERYPIGDASAPAGREFLERCREQVARSGVCELDGFLRPEATTRLAAEATARASLAHHHEGKSTPYLELPAEHWPEGHPRKRWDAYSLGAIAFDEIPGRSARPLRVGSVDGVRAAGPRPPRDPPLRGPAGCVQRERVRRGRSPEPALRPLRLRRLPGAPEAGSRAASSGPRASSARPTTNTTTASARSSTATPATSRPSPCARAPSCSSRDATACTACRPLRVRRSDSWRCSPTTPGPAPARRRSSNGRATAASSSLAELAPTNPRGLSSHSRRRTP